MVRAFKALIINYYFWQNFNGIISISILIAIKLRYGKLGESTGNARSLLDEAKNTEMAALKAEQEEADKERKAELDQEDQLTRARQFDDWKDDHRRGYGNRHNMG